MFFYISSLFGYGFGYASILDTFGSHFESVPGLPGDPQGPPGVDQGEKTTKTAILKTCNLLNWRSKMKLFVVLLMVAIAIKLSVTRYLLVEVEGTNIGKLRFNMIS